jgi:hypothetical protein
MRDLNPLALFVQGSKSDGTNCGLNTVAFLYCNHLTSVILSRSLVKNPILECKVYTKDAQRIPREDDLQGLQVLED